MWFPNFNQPVLTTRNDEFLIWWYVHCFNWTWNWEICVIIFCKDARLCFIFVECRRENKSNNNSPTPDLYIVLWLATPLSLVCQKKGEIIRSPVCMCSVASATILFYTRIAINVSGIINTVAWRRHLTDLSWAVQSLWLLVNEVSSKTIIQGIS